MSDTSREVRLPSKLCQAAERKFGERFGTLEQFLTFVMEELVRDDAESMDQAEQRIVEERLKDLGYI